MDDRYFDDDSYSHNEFSGDAEYVVQAREVHGGVNYYDSSYGTFEYRILPYAGVVFYLALFVAARLYEHIFSTVDLGFLDWLKLVVSTVILASTFITTHFWIYSNPSFRFLRFALALVIIVVGLNQGTNILPMSNLDLTVANWIIWRF